MKTKKNNIIRMENLINNDRLKNGGGFIGLLTGDIDRVLKDYFDYKGYPNVEVVKNSGNFAVTISLSAERIKAFSSLPENQ